MSTLRFAANNANCQFNLPAAVDLTAAFTLAMLLRFRGTTPWYALLTHNSSGGAVQLGTELSNSGSPPNLEIDINAGATSRLNVTGLSDTTNWCLIAFTHTAGTTTPRFHMKNITTGGAWTHENFGGTLGDPPSASGGKIIVGEYGGADDLDANVALIGGWAAALADTGAGSVESLATNSRTSDWTGLSTAPKYVHELTSTSAISDLMGNGATFISTSAALDSGVDPTGWTFDGLGGGGGGGVVASAGLHRLPLGV